MSYGLEIWACGGECCSKRNFKLVQPLLVSGSLPGPAKIHVSPQGFNLMDPESELAKSTPFSSFFMAKSLITENYPADFYCPSMRGLANCKHFHFLYERITTYFEACAQSAENFFPAKRELLFISGGRIHAKRAA